MRTLRYAALALAIAPVLSNCSSEAEESAPAPVAAVQTAPAKERAFQDVIVAYGTVELAPSHSEAVTVQAESQVAELFVVTGASVRKGDPLLRLKGSAAASLEAEKAQRDAVATQKEAERIARLHADGLATDSELRAAGDAAQTAKELRESLAKRTGSVAGITLRAPRAGIVDGLTAQPGDILAPGTLIARIADTSAWQVRLGVEPDDIARVQVGQSVELGGLTGTRSTAGSIRYVDDRLDPTSRVATAIVAGQDGLGLPSGSGVRGRITVGTHEHAVAVPRAAVLYEADRPYVFVVAQGKAQRRDVAIGFQDDKDIETTSGVKAGEPVVILGNSELTDGMAIRVASDNPEQSKS
jgi:membrane fusion protein (multidrug efflux system)